MSKDDFEIELTGSEDEEFLDGLVQEHMKECERAQAAGEACPDYGPDFVRLLFLAVGYHEQIESLKCCGNCGYLIMPLYYQSTEFGCGKKDVVLEILDPCDNWKQREEK